MKVAFVSQPFDQVVPPQQNSVGIWTYEVARRLGSRPVVLARRPRGHALCVDLDGVEIRLVTCAPPGAWARLSRVWRSALPHAQPLFARSFYSIEYLIQVARQLRRLEPDVIHVQNLPWHLPAIRRAAPGAAIVLHMHCDWLVDLDRRGLKHALAAADLVVGCSAHIVNAARARFPDIDAPFAVLPNGAPAVNPAPLGRRIEPDSVLFVGRITPEKGLHTLLAAWPRVVAARPAARLHIVGPEAETPRELLVDLSSDRHVRALARFYRGGSAWRGSYARALRAMLPSGVAGSVQFIDYEPHERLLARYAEAAVVVNPSLSESFGMSLVEALAMGTPVVATRVGGMVEVIEATGGGVLVDRNDPAGLAEAILDLIEDEPRRLHMGQAGAAEVARRYAWPRIAALTRELHEAAMAARKSSARMVMPAASADFHRPA
ncbi:MAG: glycosyltransferase family 4 protein [Hyphomicrobiaceae bacterium]|nr:glycosyltransferase family 4 protein [Hyphomicrobiaceae bacterium]